MREIRKVIIPKFVSLTLLKYRKRRGIWRGPCNYGGAVILASVVVPFVINTLNGVCVVYNILQRQIDLWCQLRILDLWTIDNHLSNLFT